MARGRWRGDRRSIIYEQEVKGSGDKETRGAGRDTAAMIAMGLLGDTAADVTEKDSRTQRKNTTGRWRIREGERDRENE